MMNEACRFHSLARRLWRMVLKTTEGSDTIRNETSHCRWLGGGLFIKRRGMLMRLPTRFHMLVTALRVRVISPKPQFGRKTLIPAGSFAGPFLPATRFAFP